LEWTLDWEITKLY